MENSEARDIISRERRFLEQWLDQRVHSIKDREVTRCLLTLREAARYVPHHEAAAVARIVELAEARLNSAR